MGLEFEGVTKTYKTENGVKEVLRDVRFCMPHQQISVLLGPSGGGKTTILRLAAAYEKPDSGKILCDGEPVNSPSHKRFMVFQSFNQLFPWKSIGNNISYALTSTQGIAEAKAWQIADYWLNEVGLYANRYEYPSRLSGGMKQRAAIARAFAVKPSLLLLDEPFSALDYDNKMALLALLVKLYEKERLTVVFVTHDRNEAGFLSNNAFVLSNFIVEYHEQPQ